MRCGRGCRGKGRGRGGEWESERAGGEGASWEGKGYVEVVEGECVENGGVTGWEAERVVAVWG